MRNRRVSTPLRIVLGFVGCGTLFSLVALGLYIYLFGNPWDANPFDNSPFNRAMWLKDAECVTAGNRRAGMEQDLLRHWLNHNMTRQQVLNLLGNPDSESDTVEIGKNANHPTPRDKSGEHTMKYYLGEELGGVNQGQYIDRAWLVLHFDASGHFREGTAFTPHSSHRWWCMTDCAGGH